ncbi:MAG TPA: lipopolysaccharide biosynthesis protein [Thermoanaerobaculia bacterium]|nr:lipopolysaccharide biosynthesis protein [Thermoanaerobaculia bacterium]
MPSPPRPSLAADSARGVLWLGSSELVGQGLHLVIRVILARLLVPEDFGLVAMALVFAAIPVLVADLGLGPALVQRPELTERHKSTAFWAAAALAGVCFLALFLAAPWVGAFYRNPEVVPLLRALSVTIVLAAPESVYNPLLVREMQFGLLGVRKVVATVLGGALGIAWALAGGGAWALVVDSLARSAIGSLLFVVHFGGLPRLEFSRRHLAELWVVSRSILGARGLNFLSRNVDNVIIGRYLGSAALGLYSLGYQAVLVPLQSLVRPLTGVAFPAFSRIQEDLERCRRGYLRMLRLVVTVTWPVTVLGALAAGELIPLVFGDEWLGAVTPFRLLCLVALLQASTHFIPSLLNGLGRPEVTVRLMLAALALNVAGFVAGLPWGVSGVTAGYLAATALITPAYFAAAAKLVRLEARQLAGALLRPLPGLAAAAAVWWALAGIVPDLFPGFALGVKVLAALAAYGALALIFLRETCHFAITTLGGSLGRTGPGPKQTD